MHAEVVVHRQGDEMHQGLIRIIEAPRTLTSDDVLHGYYVQFKRTRIARGRSATVRRVHYLLNATRQRVIAETVSGEFARTDTLEVRHRACMGAEL